MPSHFTADDVPRLSYEQADFTLSYPELLARQTYKWGRHLPGVIASCVADMDFRTAPQVQAVLQRNLDHFDYTYPLRDGQRADLLVGRTFAARMKQLYEWEVEPTRVLAVADLVQAVYATVMAFSEPGDGVIVQVPNYPPFREAIESTGRRLIPLEMEWMEQQHVFNLDKLEKVIDGSTRLLLLCNPQNPTGRVFTKTELQSLADFAQRHGLIVLSDEIHADLVYPGAEHLPFAKLGERVADRTVTLASATKSYNIPGLRCAVASFGSAHLLQRFFARIPLRLIGSVNSMGIDATVAAWTHGQPWLDSVKRHLLEMRRYVTDTLRQELPCIRFHLPEATYLLWMDCSALGFEGSASEFFLERARVAFSPGEAFHPAASKCVRMNFATSRPIVDEMLDRMILAGRQVS
ncbi:MalY/PatB family protein [Hydrogenophaga sp. RWCD_12]|uniref:MalY/PatB family protein n=1 Tax=Hydrogenophaga sp. RWCD_12 TaxID=3391190 RepID=UPI0039847EA6